MRTPSPAATHADADAPVGHRTATGGRDHAGGRTRATLATLAATLLVPVIASAVGSLPASAHSDEGIMEVLTAESEAPLEITIEVGIIYADDEHLAEDAEVEVTASGPGGEEVGPVDMPNLRAAIYAATFEVPTAGSWSLEVTSENPEAEASEDVTVADTPTTTTDTPTTTTETTAADTTTVAPTTTAAPADTTTPPTTGAEPVTTTVTVTEDDDDGLPVALIAAVAVVALAAIAGVVALGARSRDEDDPDVLTDPDGVDPTAADGDPTIVDEPPTT